ncbi:hypothetical protein [Rhizobium sp. BR 315]|uniref:hypothetical protein n=1 Tax=Rhizobium sp. BR 315 TaxID=3040014 RepID=UPI003D32A976
MTRIVASSLADFVILLTQRLTCIAQEKKERDAVLQAIANDDTFRLHLRNWEHLP